MNLFIAVKHSQDARYFYGGLWSGNFYPALRELGHEVVESQVDLLPASRFMHVASGFTPEEKRVRGEITQKIVEEVKQAHQKKPLDLFLSYFYNAHFDPSGFGDIHQLGIPTVNFYCNSTYQFEFVSEIAKSVRFSWHTEKAARPLYLKIEANPVWVQMGADPEIYHPIAGSARQPKACFVGQRYADRDRFLVKLIENQIPLDIFGRGWRDTDRTVTNGKDSTSLTSHCETAGGGRSNLVVSQPSNVGQVEFGTTQQFSRDSPLGAAEIASPRRPRGARCPSGQPPLDRLAATCRDRSLWDWGPVPGLPPRNDGSASSTYLGRKVTKPGSMESYLQAALLNISEQGILGGSRRTIWQWRYRSESRRLDPLLAQAVKGPAPDVCRTFNEYEIVLNFSNVWADGRPGSQLIPHVRLRDFEAPMGRNCYLTGHTDEITEFYEIGKEIDTYRTPEELVDKTRFYLTHPDEAEKLRETGYQRARCQHTWVNRFQQLFRIISLSY